MRFCSLVGVILIAALGCTRKVDTSTLKLSFSRSAAPGAQSGVTGKLSFAVVNVQLPSGPIVKNFDFHDDNGPDANDTFTLEVPDVPTGQFLVQFFGVYEQVGSPSTFTYGFSNASVGAGTTVVDVVAKSLGNFSREGHVSGRYIDSHDGSGDHGPTGELVMRFQPPDVAQPPIVLQKMPIVDGWFNIMAVDGPELSFYLGSTPLFDRVKLSGSDLVIAGVTQTLSSQLARFGKPAMARRDGDKVEAKAPSELFVGYFVKPGVSGVTTKQVCYAYDANEAARGFYDPSFAQPLDIALIGTTAGKINHGGGGNSFDMSTLYGGTACAESADNFVVYHTLLAGDDDIIKPPFAPFNPWLQYDRYMTVNFIPTGSRLRVKWKMLPGLAASALDGVAVLAKPSRDDGGDHGDEVCPDLLAQGYVEVGTVTPGTTLYDVTSAKGTSVTAANSFNWSIGLCAFKLDGTGQRRYVGKYVKGGSLTQQNVAHTGWAPASQTLNLGANASYGTGTFGAVQQLQLANAGTSAAYTLAQVSQTPAPFSSGDELMIHVAGYGTTSDCGARNGMEIRPGDYDFVRVLATDGSNTVKVTKGSLLDALDGNGNLNMTTSVGGNFCYVQLAKVLHYRDLTIPAGVTLSGTSSFNFGSPAGGLLPIRVNGTLSVASLQPFNVSGGGMKGSVSGATAGAGILGSYGAQTGTGGGSSSSYGCGGGGAGSGGQGVSCTAGFGQNLGFGSLAMGGGGGSGLSTPSGAGGGILFLSARTLVVNAGGAAVLSANGTNGSASSGSGGGGGGGSVMLFARKIQAASPNALGLTASGGNGGDANAGVGGGGFAQAVACESDTTPVLNVSKGATGSTTGAQDGNGHYYSPGDNSYQNLCTNAD